jgi:RNA polymerase sigma factor (sigma-70 family)
VASRSNGAMSRQIETLFNLGTIGERTDGQLLERFATRGGEEGEPAFAALVERHGPMVWRVCRARLRDPNDAQDAFQAVFLILVQKARSLWVRDSLGPWLHRVAYRVAERVRRNAARRLEHERRTAAARPSTAPEPRGDDDLAAMLHEEIERLPARCRQPLILCDAQGLTHQEAALRLGWPLGTVKTRLARARELLRGRLSRRNGLPPGLLIAAPRLVAVFRGELNTPAAPLVESTVRAAAAVATGESAAAQAISARVAELFKEVIYAMFLTKLKIASAVVLTAVAATGVAGALAQSGGEAEPGPGPKGNQPPPRAASADDSSKVPRHVSQSREIVLRRLEEKADKARSRFDRIAGAGPDRKVSADDQRTIQEFRDLQARLDKIDRILYNAIETHPALFDGFEAPPTENDADVQSDLERPPASAPTAADRQSAPADLVQAKRRLEWAKRMVEKGYLSTHQYEVEMIRFNMAVESQTAQPKPTASSLPQPSSSLDSNRKPMRYFDFNSSANY